MLCLNCTPLSPSTSGTFRKRPHKLQSQVGRLREARLTGGGGGNFESHLTCSNNFSVYSIHQLEALYHIDVLIQVTKCSIYSSCIVTHYSICVCSDIEIWVSGCLPEAQNDRKIQIISVESGRGRLREVLNITI